MPGAVPARRASALAASASVRMRVSSSMIRRWTGWIRQAASAAKVWGSRLATLQAKSICPAADCWDRCSSQASSSAANSPSRPVPARRANSPTAAISVHADRDSRRRAAEMMPSSWSSEQPASPEPSSPVTVSTTVASSAPGTIVSASPPWANPDRVSCSAGKHTYRPCGMPSSSGPGSSSAGSGEPSGSCSSPGGLGNGSWSTQHRPFGRKPEITPYEQSYHNVREESELYEHILDYCDGDLLKRGRGARPARGR